jgi:large subunit ribosomal protein L35
MPKLKTHKGMAKRIKVSANGKLLRRKAFRNHLFSHKQASTKRTYVNEFEISTGDTANVKRMLGTYK